MPRDIDPHEEQQTPPKADRGGGGFVDTVPLPIPQEYPVSLRQRLRAVACFLAVVVSGYFGTLFLLGPLLPLAYLAPSSFLFFVDCSIQLWNMLTEVLLGGILQIRIRQFGDTFINPSLDDDRHTTTTTTTGSSSIFILNHRTRLDWLFVYSIGRYGRQLKYTLKREMGYVPGLGWAMQIANFILLHRKIALDKPRINQAIRYLIRYDGATHLLLFPEGTNSCPESIVRSDRYAAKTGKPRWRYTLHPRTTGFEWIARAMDKELAYVYDVTVAYPFALTDSELWMAVGNFPQEVHFHVKRFSVAHIPPPSEPTDDLATTTTPLGRWLEQRWAEKEALLKEYYAAPPADRKFPGGEVERDGALINHTDDNVDEHWSPNACMIIAFWFFFLYLALCLLYYSWLARIYALIFNVFCIYQSFKTGLGEWVADLAGVPLHPHQPVNTNQDDKIKEGNNDK